MRAQIAKLKKPQTLPPPLLALGAAHVKKKKRQGKNAPNIPIHELSWQWNQEVDLLTTAYFVFTAYFVPKGHKYVVQVCPLGTQYKYWRYRTFYGAGD